MSESFQKCTISFNQRFFFSFYFAIFYDVCCCYSHVYECVQHFHVQSFYSFFFKNEVVDVQNEVAMDICLDLTCAW